ncbi:diguanylate cyclase [Fluoribacter gormanii]|uniref:diguanylate cyclase n=1 Tax=Fluoribacter gormanii TaxID=464 RepID=UPI002244399C|nr:diguanylate cyclase [Fluoribacter gormanii]MCW8444527.1 diguanylate cyclase [Fluoribacter gormanii]
MPEKNTLNTKKELHAEIERLNKIIKALIDRAEQDMNAPRTDFGVFQNTVILEDKVKKRTQELEEALQINAKIARDLQQAKKQVEQSEQHLRDITSALGEGLLVINKEGKLEFVNAAACSMLGYDEAEMLGQNAHELFHHCYYTHDPYPMGYCKNLEVIQTEKPYASDDDYFWRKDGTCFPVSLITTPIMLKNNKGIVIAFHDITKSVEERNRLREMQAAIEQSPVSVLIVDKQRTIIYANPQIIKLTGYSKEELYGKKTDIFHNNMTPRSVLTDLWKKIQSGISWTGELLYHRKNGSTFWQSWSIAPVFNTLGEIQHFVGVGEDISEKKKLQVLLQEMSYLDGLTAIANRRRFDDFLKQEWKRALRYSKPIAIIMMDIDFFKRYNDSLGHLAGDDALKFVAQALKKRVTRSTDLLARYGGEEFTCILPDTQMEGAIKFAESLRQAVRNLELPHPDSDASRFVTISVGVAACIPKEDNPTRLLDLADDAMYRAKTLGRNRVEFIDLIK